MASETIDGASFLYTGRCGDELKVELDGTLRHPLKLDDMTHWRISRLSLRFLSKAKLPLACDMSVAWLDLFPDADSTRSSTFSR
jgi:hypothetical protein